MTIDDDKLMAYLDSELGEDERLAVEQALAADPALRDRLDQQRRLREALRSHYGPVAAENVPERLLSMLGADESARADTDTGNIASLGEARERRRRFRTPDWRNLGAMAATLAVGFFAGQLVPSDADAPFASENGALVARGDLARALETQLASAQASSADPRIGVTFADRQGRPCRTFGATALEGLACRDDRGWALVMTAARYGASATQYRQAGSSPVLAAAQEMMSGAPFDSAREQAAVESNWNISAGAAD
jgi:hypothetical protein